MFDRKVFSVTTLNLVIKLLVTSCYLILPYHTTSPMFDSKIFSVTTLNVVPKLLKKLLHFVMFYHILSHFITPYLSCSIEKYFQWQIPI